MAELKYSVLLLFVISACSQAASNTKVTIDNKLSNCIKIDHAQVIYKDELPMLKVVHQQIQATSECGCKSAISMYSSQLEMDGYNSQLLIAKFSFGKNNRLNIPIAASKKIIGSHSVLITFSCAAPD